MQQILLCDSVLVSYFIHSNSLGVCIYMQYIFALKLCFLILLLSLSFCRGFLFIAKKQCFLRINWFYPSIQFCHFTYGIIADSVSNLSCLTCPTFKDGQNQTSPTPSPTEVMLFPRYKVSAYSAVSQTEGDFTLFMLGVLWHTLHTVTLHSFLLHVDSHSK